ncbi:hypothetical protein BCR34DRAFT_308330 [Clohesyomyces aquaticus]|uniref:Uncharacterized protein n=1 Tax=Clohesyomyces aquaticus TaxID=1231657 RepID=A0A1Y1ZQK3_9PLEO|nr:hypothetical protein BCR34DRAFT_308330 [Clohesyomyces aquaticus]
MPGRGRPWWRRRVCGGVGWVLVQWNEVLFDERPEVLAGIGVARPGQEGRHRQFLNTAPTTCNSSHRRINPSPLRCTIHHRRYLLCPARRLSPARPALSSCLRIRGLTAPPAAPLAPSPIVIARHPKYKTRQRPVIQYMLWQIIGARCPSRVRRSLLAIHAHAPMHSFSRGRRLLLLRRERWQGLSRQKIRCKPSLSTLGGYV